MHQGTLFDVYGAIGPSRSPETEMQIEIAMAVEMRNRKCLNDRLVKAFSTSTNEDPKHFSLDGWLWRRDFYWKTPIFQPAHDKCL